MTECLSDYETNLRKNESELLPCHNQHQHYGRRKERDEIGLQATPFLIMQFMFLVCIIPKLS